MSRPLNAPARLAAFAAALALLFGAGLAAGDAFGPQRDVVDHQTAPSHRQGASPAGHGTAHPSSTSPHEADR